MKQKEKKENEDADGVRGDLSSLEGKSKRKGGGGAKQSKRKKAAKAVLFVFSQGLLLCLFFVHSFLEEAKQMDKKGLCVA